VDVSDLQPLLARDRYTDVEWEYASSGRCNWSDAQYQHLQWCGKPSDPNSPYRLCTFHDGCAQDYSGYGR
jgi:hypothetical protein